MLRLKEQEVRNSPWLVSIHSFTLRRLIKLIRSASRVRLLLWTVLAVWSFGGQADLYRYIDSQEVAHYTNDPPGAHYKLIRHSRFKEAADKVRFGGHHKEFDELILQVAREYSLEPALLHAVIRVESAYNPEAISRAGAVGLMQLMPKTAARYGVDNPKDPAQNLVGGARFLKDLLVRFQNLRLALAAYNAGEGNVLRYGKRVPPFPETQAYVRRVLGHYHNPRNGS